MLSLSVPFRKLRGYSQSFGFLVDADVLRACDAGQENEATAYLPQFNSTRHAMGDEGEVSAVVCDNGSGVVKVL